MKRFLRSIGYAWQGIVYVIKSERNMQIHIVSAILVTLLSFYFKVSHGEWTIIFIAIGLVIFAEIINTIFEKYLDFYHPEKSEKVKILKDMAAAAVLVVSFISAIIGLIIFTPKILELLNLL